MTNSVFFFSELTFSYFSKTAAECRTASHEKDDRIPSWIANSFTSGLYRQLWRPPWSLQKCTVDAPPSPPAQKKKVTCLRRKI